MKRLTSLVFFLIWIPAHAQEYYTAVAATEPFDFTGSFVYAFGWHAGSGHEAGQEAIAECNRLSGETCWTIGISGSSGACTSLVLATWLHEGMEWPESRLFGGNTVFGRDAAEEEAMNMCEAYVTSGVRSDEIREWRCDPQRSFCPADVDASAPLTSSAPQPVPSAVTAPQPGAAPSAPTAPALQPGDTFSDALSSGGEGPEMVVIPAGSFRMGCPSGQECWPDETPVRGVTIPQAFAVSKYEVTFEDYDRFTSPNRVDDRGWGRGRRPVIMMSWNDAQEYVAWLSRQTGQTYRLLSEAEWEYVARAGSETAYSWGNDIGTNRANCADLTSRGLGTCGDQWTNTAPVGSFEANAFGVYDMHGNVAEWVEDCWNESYAGAPSDGSAWRSGECSRRVTRGGTSGSVSRSLHSWSRGWYTAGDHLILHGFRVARTIMP